MKYLIVIEKTSTGYSAYSPDLPGCVSTGRTLAEIEKNIREAIEYHIEGMIEDGDPIPEPTSRVMEVELPVGLDAPSRCGAKAREARQPPELLRASSSTTVEL